MRPGHAACLGLLFLSAVASAQQSPAGAAPASPQPGEVQSGILGRVLLDGAPAPGSRVLVYPSTQTSPIGPGFVGTAVTDAEGRFGVGLSPGAYKVGVRRRAGGEGPGFLLEGSLRADVHPETVEVAEGSWTDLGDLALRPIDPGKLAGVVARGFSEPTPTVVEGRVTGTDGTPLPGFFVQAYRDPGMMGKPDAVAEVRKDGTYTLYLPEGGAYSLRARPTAGGAVHVGEPIGFVAAPGGSSLEIRPGETTRGVDLVVERGP
jgi:hypothetical protein